MKHRYTLDRGTKQIVMDIMHAVPERCARRRVGKSTEFDTMADNAIKYAEKDITLEDYTERERRNLLFKLRESLTYNIKWEDMEDIYCCRNVFYRYRKEYLYLVAKYLGMTDPEERRITKQDLKQYISQVRELDMLTDQINRMKETGENTERRQKLFESIKSETEAVESYVSSIRDSETRQIIMLKYMHPSGRMSWQKVANRMNQGGGMYTADYCRIKFDRFLK